MNPTLILLLIFILILCEIFYFKIAEKFNIVDKPNFRSSHTHTTIRGGGIIFLIALVIYSIYSKLPYPYFLFGLVLISFISFLDDLKPVSSVARIFVHFIAVILLFYEGQLFTFSYLIILFSFVLVIGIINAVNFMDGINGLTGFYTFIVACSLYFLNSYIFPFTSTDFLGTFILATIVFMFFNFRIKAKCFAGDVGSIAAAFILVFFLVQLIVKSQHLAYLLFLLIYGLDAGTTIIFRVIRKENIFNPHRSHFYQFLANEKNISHLRVATFYGVLQLIINLLVIYYTPTSIIIITTIIIISLMLFVLIRFYMEGSARLLAVKAI